MLIKLTYKKIREIENRNFNKLKKILLSCPALEIIKPKANCSTIIACKVKNFSTENFTKFFNKNKIAVRTGLQCSPNAHKIFNTFPSGTIRFSVGLFNKSYEFKKLKKVLKKLNNL